MSLEQFRTYLKTEEAKKDIVEKAREAGFEVSEEDLARVTGGSTTSNGDSSLLGKLSATRSGYDYKKGSAKL